jgi:hypothetical protein
MPDLSQASREELQAEIERRSFEPIVELGKSMGVMPSLYRLLLQDKEWTDSEGITRRLEDMTPDHRRALIGWLRARASRLQNTMHWTAYFGGLSFFSEPPDEVLYEADEQFDLDPQDWLTQTPLMTRLLELL